MSFIVALIVFFILLGVTFFLVYVLIVVFIDSVKRAKYEKSVLEHVCLELRIPKYNEYEIANAEQMYAGLHSIFKSMGKFKSIWEIQPVVSFEIVALKGKIRFFVICEKSVASLVEKQILGAYPLAEVTVAQDYNAFPENGYVEYTQLCLEKEPYYSLITYAKLSNDPLNLLVSALSKVGDNEALVVQVLISPASSKWQKAGRNLLNSIEKPISTEKGESSGSRPKIPAEITNAISEKISKVGFNTVIRLISVAGSQVEAKTNLNNLEATFKQFASSEGNKFTRYKPKFIRKILSSKTIVYDFINRIPPIELDSSILNTAELASVFHLPNKKVESPIINWLLSKKAPPDETVPTSGLWLGRSNYRGMVRDVAMANIDDRRRHMYVIGSSGTGKSFFLQNLILQDIRAGHGVCYIDPHGDSVEWILERIPPHRIEDVIYWNPADFERPIGFNILENRSEEEKHFIVNSFYKMIQKLFDPNQQGITGPILERAIRSVLLTAMAKKGGTLIEALKCLLLDWDIINEYKQYTDDPFVHDYWDKEIPATPENRRGELMGYFTSKLDRFVSNRLMRNIIGQTTSSFDLRTVMDTGKILLVNLSKGLIGQENSEFLGLLLVPKILSSAMSRVDIPLEQRRDFFLYVDEFQNFATDDFATILSEARKFRLNLIVANQYINQLRNEVKDAVFGNVGSIVCFRVGNDDAKYLESLFEPVFNSSDLTGLDQQNACVKLLVNGRHPAPFSICTTLDEIPRGDKALKEAIINISRMVYGRDRAVVEADIMKRMKINKK